MINNLPYYADQKLPWLAIHDFSPEVVIHSEMSFIRNVEDLPFKLTKSQFDSVSKILRDNCLEDFRFYHFKDLSTIEVQFLFERYYTHSDDGGVADSIAVQDEALFVSSNDITAVFLNVKDNLRIIYKCAGADLLSMYYELDTNLETVISQHFNYTKHNKYGLLCSNPLFSGNGLSIETTLNLFALNFFQQLDSIQKSLKVFDLELVPKISVEQNCLFVLLNSSSVAYSNDKLIETFQKLLKKIIFLEKEARKELFSVERDRFFEFIAHAYTRLRFSQSIHPFEALICSHMVRVGVLYNLFKKISFEDINYLLTISQPYHFLQKLPIEPRTLPLELSSLIRSYLK